MTMMMICQGWVTKVSAHSADDLGYEAALIFLSNAPCRVITILIAHYRTRSSEMDVAPGNRISDTPLQNYFQIQIRSSMRP